MSRATGEQIAIIRRGWMTAALTVTADLPDVSEFIDARLTELELSAEFAEPELLRIVEDTGDLVLSLGTSAQARDVSRRLRRTVYEFLLALDASATTNRATPIAAPQVAAAPATTEAEAGNSENSPKASQPWIIADDIPLAASEVQSDAESPLDRASEVPHADSASPVAQEPEVPRADIASPLAHDSEVPHGDAEPVGVTESSEGAPDIDVDVARSTSPQPEPERTDDETLAAASFASGDSSEPGAAKEDASHDTQREAVGVAFADDVAVPTAADVEAPPADGDTESRATEQHFSRLSDAAATAEPESESESEAANTPSPAPRDGFHLLEPVELLPTEAVEAHDPESFSDLSAAEPDVGSEIEAVGTAQFSVLSDPPEEPTPATGEENGEHLSAPPVEERQDEPVAEVVTGWRIRDPEDAGQLGRSRSSRDVPSSSWRSPDTDRNLEPTVNLEPARRQIEQLLRRKKFDQVGAVLQQLAQESGGRDVATFALAVGDRCRTKSKRMAATSCYLAASRADPVFEEPLARLADVCIDEKDVDLAVSYLERIARLTRLRGDTNGALRIYRKIHSIAPYRNDILELLVRADATGQIDG